MHLISKVIGINDKMQICLPNKESKRDHTCERANMAAK